MLKMAAKPQIDRHRPRSGRSTFHSVANFAAAKFMRGLFESVGRIHFLRRENAERAGGFLLASNHISHFDPLIISGVVRRKIDWMAMAEFFPKPVVGQFLRAVDAFPADRHRADRKTIRTAIERLRRGRAVGIFPEGGIRHGEMSILHGARLRSGVSALADIASVPIVPCVILGSDRLYRARRWLALRRTPIWIAFGDAIRHSSDREQIEIEFNAALQKLYTELRETFALTPNDLPHSPQERMKE
jgi:1-acyl-sn-glycerol-3-phosphate acyltransferase